MKDNWVSYKNGNYTVALNTAHGTKIRYNDLDFFRADRPENMDIKITNRCTNPCGTKECPKNCEFCHENSGPNGKHSDALHSKFLETLPEWTECACLSGNTIAHGEFGCVELKDLKIGDKIYDSDYQLRTISNISISHKPCYRVKGDYGLNIICSADHPFMVNGKQVLAKDLIGKCLDQLEMVEDNNQEHSINLRPFITRRNENLVSSRGGKDFNDGTIRLRNSTPRVPADIKLTPELMWAYGLFVAEGSKKGYSLNYKEIEFASRIIAIWHETTGNYCRIYPHKEKNNVIVETRPASMNEDLFVKAMGCGKGAHNKNLSFLYSINNKELIRWALIGLIDGDGCFRTRFHGNRPCYSFSLKTVSKSLAYDFSFLLLKWFGIKCTVYHGWSPARKIEDRILAPGDYYKVDACGYDSCVKLFGNYYGELQRPLKLMTKKYSVVRSVTKVEDEPLYDITLDSGSHIFPVNGGWLTHNCGGGNVLEYPDLVPLLQKMKNLHLISNITVNQKHFMENLSFLRELVNQKLIYGLGISLTNPYEEGFIAVVKTFPNAVIHVINGVVTLAQLSALGCKDLKILILGYKEVRRGVAYKADVDHLVELRKNRLYASLPFIAEHNWFKTISFDNLAIEQLEPKRFLSDEFYQTHNLGDDGLMGEQTSASYYVDLVENVFARNSCDVNHRYPLENHTATECYQLLRDSKI